MEKTPHIRQTVISRKISRNLWWSGVGEEQSGYHRYAGCGQGGCEEGETSTSGRCKTMCIVNLSKWPHRGNWVFYFEVSPQPQTGAKHLMQL